MCEVFQVGDGSTTCAMALDLLQSEQCPGPLESMCPIRCNKCHCCSNDLSLCDAEDINGNGASCEMVWNAMQAQGITECPESISELCPKTCGTCIKDINPSPGIHILF